ncbi:MAG: hypothetical protein EA425_06250 [Puniceicoccaceae bacterium]|nr:MAG: hypothetical protein EA425_06250 [Puniceicoccaceae bacterium]
MLSCNLGSNSTRTRTGAPAGAESRRPPEDGAAAWQLLRPLDLPLPEPSPAGSVLTMSQRPRKLGGPKPIPAWVIVVAILLLIALVARRIFI